MTRDCVTYKELADYLQISHKTMLNIWREYPHFFVTSKSRATNSIKAARFNIDNVLEYLSSLTQHEVVNEKHTGNIKKRRNNRLSSLLPLQGEDVHKAVPTERTGRGMADQRKEKNPRKGGRAEAFDVFDWRK